MAYAKVPDDFFIPVGYFEPLNKKYMPKKKHSQDRKLIAWTQPYEVAHLCRIWKAPDLISGKLKNIKALELRTLAAKLPHKHSLKEVEACLIGAGYTKHPRKKAVKELPDLPARQWRISMK